MRQQQQEKYLAQYLWQAGGTITTQQALLGASALTHAAVEALADANKVLIEIPQGWLAMELRFYSDAAANIDDIVQLYIAATSDSLPDHYRHFAQLTLIVGTQVYGSYKFHDTVIPANEAWITRSNEVSPANNTFGGYVLNTHGNSKILVIASDLDSTTLGVDYRKV
ncbi:MAG: hypothetical protein ACYSSI_00105 [Planctomycetota bacterium]|jgi:hypothetical protein